MTSFPPLGSPSILSCCQVRYHGARNLIPMTKSSSGLKISQKKRQSPPLVKAP
ncbi:hypothetical protein AZE42_12253 [Rhizopogon vesiculosus]|uniref:Uncharacterized protein n=1 Tax=Rhizopogon vesiculosus TaxID=180088 RepID=A0A1J8PN88_9AGAM|nr:hypothetical protein AZE42_12253 [Rhizopogon vesiculosus]